MCYIAPPMVGVGNEMHDVMFDTKFNNDAKEQFIPISKTGYCLEIHTWWV